MAGAKCFHDVAHRQTAFPEQHEQVKQQVGGLVGQFVGITCRRGQGGFNAFFTDFLSNTFHAGVKQFRCVTALGAVFVALGDHALGSEDSRGPYEDEIRWLADQTDAVDVGFMSFLESAQSHDDVVDYLVANHDGIDGWGQPIASL